MAKIAKIALSADIKEFQAKMKETKKAFMDLSAMKISPKISNEFEKRFKEDLVESAETLKDKMGDIEKAMDKLAKRRGDIYDSDAADKLTRKHAEYNKELQRTNSLLKEIDNREGPSGPPSPGGGPSGPPSPGGGRGGFRRAMGGIRGVAGTVGLGLGVGSIFNRGVGIAKEETALRGLTGGALVEGRSELGFTPSERRQRGGQVARAAGRDVSGEELTKLVDQGEQIERAFNISGGEQAGVQGAARKAGVKDQQKFMADSIGDALVAGLSGSSINEYLQSMAGHMEGMSKGINVNDSSLRGISSAMAELPFFKSDPARIFDALGDIDKTFQGGDRFQEAMSNLAIRQAGGGGSPAAVHMRRKMGLFGDMDLEDERAKKGETAEEKSLRLERNKKRASQRAFLGTDTPALMTKPEEILKNMFTNIMKTGEGRTGMSQLQRFQSATGMKPGAAKELFFKMKDDPNFKFAKGDIDKFRDAQKSPEDLMADRIKNTMDDFSKTMLTANEKVAVGLENVVKDFSKPMGDLVNKIDDNIASMETLTKAIIALTMVQTVSGLFDFFKKGPKTGGGGILTKGKDLLKGGVNKGKELFKGALSKIKKIPFKAAGTAIKEGAKRGGGMLLRGGGMLARGAARFGGPIAAVMSALDSPDVGAGSDDVEAMRKKYGGGDWLNKSNKKGLSHLGPMSRGGIPMARPEEKSSSFDPSGEGNMKATDANTLALQKLTELMSMLNFAPGGGGGGSRGPLRVGTPSRGGSIGKR